MEKHDWLRPLWSSVGPSCPQSHTRTCRSCFMTLIYGTNSLWTAHLLPSQFFKIKAQDVTFPRCPITFYITVKLYIAMRRKPTRRHFIESYMFLWVNQKTCAMLQVWLSTDREIINLSNLYCIWLSVFPSVTWWKQTLISFSLSNTF